MEEDRNRLGILLSSGLCTQNRTVPSFFRTNTAGVDRGSSINCIRLVSTILSLVIYWFHAPLEQSDEEIDGPTDSLQY